MHIFYLIPAIGLLILLAGIFMSKYPKESRFLALKEFNLESIAHSKLIGLLLKTITKDTSFILNKISLTAIKESETNISLQALYLVKIFSCLFTATLILLINFTNMDITRVNIITKSGSSLDIFGTKNNDKMESDKEYNYSLYYSILNKVNEENSFDEVSEDNKKEIVYKAIPEIINSSNKADIEYNAEKFMSTYYALKNIRVFDWKSVLIAMSAFFVPDIFLFLKQLLLGSIYRKEVTKLENIFELLGSIEGFKTTDILGQMSNGSRMYRKHMNECRALFKTDRKLAVQTLKLATKNKKMSQLVDTIRIYSLVDKKLAMDILAKNRRSRNEGILITADEDMDWVDIMAFLSITPLLYELANLLMKPMLDMIFDAFKYV